MNEVKYELKEEQKYPGPGSLWEIDGSAYILVQIDSDAACELLYTFIELKSGNRWMQGRKFLEELYESTENCRTRRIKKVEIESPC